MLTVAGVLVLCAALFGGWLWFSERAAHSVRVTWADHSPRCSGTSVHRRTSVPVLEAVKGMNCAITVRILNNGPVGVHLETATAQFVGAGTGTVVAATNADPAAADDVDARYDLARSLGPGQSYEFAVTLGFHPAGCNDNGRFWVRNWPRVRLTVLGLAHERVANQVFSFHRSGRTPGCSS